MNDKKRECQVLAGLRRVLFLRALALTVAAIAIVLFLQELFRGHMANWIVDWLMYLLSTDQDSAAIFYFYKIRANMEVLIGIVILMFMLLLFWIMLYTFQSYFTQIVKGIDQIVDGDAPIVLLPELQLVEQKLNHVKSILCQRKQEAQEQEQKKNDFIVYLAHDIRTPLTCVIGYLSLLDENTELPAKQRNAYLHIVKEQCNRLERLVEEFFELTRYHLQDVPLDKRQINLCFMLDQLSEELYPLLTVSEKTIQNNIPTRIELSCDSDKLARAFSNILKNAIAYSADRSTILVSAQQVEDTVIVAFQNTGTIPKEALDTIFEKFFRLSAARSSAAGGTGLGLAIARDIITLHGGTIRAESAHGQTVFTVELPMC